jgi:hypothetical protein
MDSISLEYVELSRYIASRVSNPMLNRQATSISLGVAISKAIAVGSMAQGNITHQWDTVLVHTALELVGAFNEQIIVDTELAMETARAFWIMRCNALNADLDQVILPSGVGTFIEKVFGLNENANPKTIAFCNDNSAVVATITNRICTLLSNKFEVEPTA